VDSSSGSSASKAVKPRMLKAQVSNESRCAICLDSWASVEWSGDTAVDWVLAAEDISSTQSFSNGFLIVDPHIRRVTLFSYLGTHRDFHIGFSVTAARLRFAPNRTVLIGGTLQPGIASLVAAELAWA
jgi:hypothetical protein